MRAALALIFALLLFLPGCMTGELSGKEGACLEEHTSTVCTQAALGYAILQKDRGGAVSMCAAIDAPTGDVWTGSAQDRCYMQVAEALQDRSVCSYIWFPVTQGICEQSATRPVRTPLCGIAFVLPALAILALFFYRD